MKRVLYIIFCYLVFSFSLFGQMITTDPALPAPGKLIKIYYNSSADAGTLHNYTGDLYAHTGVTIQGLAWQKVIGTWGNNSMQPKLNYNGNFIYELDIAPDIKTFYSLASTDIVTKICLVIRNAAGDKQTSPDIFINVFQNGLNITFTLPVKSSFVTELNKKIIVQTSATLADSISLYINNIFIKSGATADLLTDTIIPDQYGEFWVKAIAWAKPSFAADSFFCYVRKPIVTETLPGGWTDGINYISNTSVALVLHAPYKNYVFATGDFTDWLAREKGYMKRTPDGERFWVQIDGLKPGKEYRFQYLVDTALYIGEPYCDKVLDPDNDQYITASTYPNLIQYPKDTASGIVSVLQTAQVPYTWQTTSYTPPKQSNLIIYELLVRDFTANHNYKTLIDTLDYLVNLGINAIELMPVNEFEGNISWGYNPSFYFAPDKYYGLKNDLKAFIDKCHSKGIAVIMDMVLNHCFEQSPFVQLYLDHIGTDQIYMKLPNPWFNAQSPNPVYHWGADFNHESNSTQQLVDRINAYWLTEYKVDGFRFDFTKGFTNTPGDGSAYDASRITILERMADQIWKVNSSAYVILEHFTANSEEIVLADYGMMLWGNNNYNYAEAAMGYSSDLTAVSAQGVGWTVPNLVSYMESHDEERIMYKTITYGAASGSYNTRNLKIALKRMELDALFLLTVPGPKMIWQFGELGYDISIDSAGRTGEKPIKWDYFSDPDRHRLYIIYKLLNNLRSSQPVFGTGSYSYSLSTPLKSIQLFDPTMNVDVLGNFGLSEGSITPTFPQSGIWYEYFTGDSINVLNINDQINLQPGEYRLYTTKKLASPTSLLGINDLEMTDNAHFVSVYPNPSAGEFTFGIQSLYPTAVSLSVFDITGKIIRQLKTSISTDEVQSVKWDGKSANGTSVPGGIYFVQVRTATRSETVKIIKQ
ncbi:MAG: alpha-amylase family glycosyl hydrolase [Bacteroidales bacterium]